MDQTTVWIRLDGRGPRFQQLHRALRDAIADGTLPAGARVPATRTLADELGVSRTTVLLAYEQLAAEGWVAGRHGAGTFVQAARAAARPVRPPTPPATPPRLAKRAAALNAGRARPLLSAHAAERPSLPIDFRYGMPSLHDLPLDAWRRCVARRARKAPARAYFYGHPQGAPALREALAAHLARSRGLVCDPAQIVVVTGSQQGLDLVARTLIDPGDAAVVEEPGYEGARNALRAAGARLVPVPVDADGLVPERLPRRRVRVAVVTPAHQFPLGGVLPAARRTALLAWAARAGATIVEDDYDGEFRFGGPPLQALAGLDGDGRVLHLGTFSKVMFPALRLGWLVAPPALVEPLLRAKVLADGGSPTLEQEALAEFLAGGGFERHVRRARARNAARRAVLCDALATHLGDRAVVAGTDAGLHLVVWLRDVPSSGLRTVVRRAADAGVGVYPVAPYYAGEPPGAGLILGYASLEPREIREGVRRLAGVLR